MRWFKPNLRTSIYAIFSSSQAPVSAPAQPEVSVDDIRDAMLCLLAGAGPESFPHVTRRIRYAVDVQALWFLRGDLMAVLSSRYGEAVALRHLQSVSGMFEGMLPHSLRSRPSPLGTSARD